jgi:hypothetical protein
MLRVLVCVLLAVACDSPTAPPAAEFCGVAELRLPLSVGGAPFFHTLIIPRRCPTEAR